MSIKVITGKVRASFVHVFEPQSINGSEPKGYTQPAYDPATRTYTVQWTWVYWQDAPLGGDPHANGTAGL